MKEKSITTALKTCLTLMFQIMTKKLILLDQSLFPKKKKENWSAAPHESNIGQSGAS